MLEFDTTLIPVQFLTKIADLLHQFALTGHGIGEDAALLEYQLREAAGFGQLDVAKGFFLRCAGERGVKTELDQALVEFGFVLHERNLQLVAAEIAAETFEIGASALIGGVGGGEMALGLLNLATEKMRLVTQNGGIEGMDGAQGQRALVSRLLSIASANGNLCQQEMTQDRLVFQERPVKELRSALREATRFVVTALVKKHDGLV